MRCELLEREAGGRVSAAVGQVQGLAGSSGIEQRCFVRLWPHVTEMRRERQAGFESHLGKMAKTRAKPCVALAMQSTALPLSALSLSPRQTVAVPSDVMHGRWDVALMQKDQCQGGFLGGEHLGGKSEWCHPHLLSYSRSWSWSFSSLLPQLKDREGHTLACPSENLLRPVVPPSDGTMLSSCLCNPVFL